MAKMFKNIDEFTREAYSQGSTKVPAHVKENLTKTIGTGIGLGTWILGSLGVISVGIVSVLAINSSDISEGYAKSEVSAYTAAFNDNSAKSGLTSNYQIISKNQTTG